MGQKIFFWGLFSFFLRPFQGGHFLGEIIYLTALDLRPATLNVRPALAPSRSGVLTSLGAPPPPNLYEVQNASLPLSSPVPPPSFSFSCVVVYKLFVVIRNENYNYNFIVN